MWVDFEDSDSEQQVALELDQGEKTSASMAYIVNVHCSLFPVASDLSVVIILPSEVLPLEFP